MLHYFNVTLFDVALFDAALFIVAFFTIAQSNVTLCKCPTILYCTSWRFTLFMLHYLILNYSIFRHFDIALRDVALSNPKCKTPFSKFLKGYVCYIFLI